MSQSTLAYRSLAPSGSSPASVSDSGPQPLLPEDRLLLLTAGGPANDAAIRSAAEGPIDWARLLGLARVERAVPVVYPRLRDVAGALIPSDVLEQLRRLALVSDFAMLHLEARLRESLRVLEHAGVRVMLLKGAALAYSAYGGVRQRPMSDIDILVDSGNAMSARRAMLNAGWRTIQGGMPEAVYEHHHHLPPVHDARSPELQLEIHTALFPERHPFAFETSDLWATSRSLGPPLSNAVVPAPAHLLLHACIHFFWSHQARFGVWRTIRDLDAISRAGTVDWGAFVATARSARALTSCYWTFRIAELAAGVTAPKEVMETLRPARRAYLRRAIERHLLLNLFPVRSVCPSARIEHVLWEMAAMPRWSGHGDVRPWDDEPNFVIPDAPARDVRTARRTSPVLSALAVPKYMLSLMRSQRATARRPRGQS